MDAPKEQVIANGLSLRKALPFAVGAVVTFQLAYTFPACSFLIAAYLWCLFQLTRLQTSRLAAYLGLAVGLLCYGPQLFFFWTIFGPAAIALWWVLGFWLGTFLLLARSCRVNFGETYAVLLIPFLWTGLEYFRSELYYLRFSWLSAGFPFSHNLSWLPLNRIGVYGIGFLLMSGISLCALLRARQRLIAMLALVLGLGMLTNLPARAPMASSEAASVEVQVAGMQLEFPTDGQVIPALNSLVKQFPQAQILVLSEYTFDGPVPESIKTWCKKNQRYLVVGAKDPVGSDYYNTAFVIGPAGGIVFRQAKCVPIQFFKDGLPAMEQKLWDSPWGRIGLCVCYDLSYSRVIDGLARLGAQAIIVPTMDVVDWSRHQHELHARVAPMRAAEYGVPIFRLASSGISQCVDSSGRVTATAPMPGDGAVISGTLRLGKSAVLPWGRVIAPISTAVTVLIVIWLAGVFLWRKYSTRIKPETT